MRSVLKSPFAKASGDTPSRNIRRWRINYEGWCHERELNSRPRHYQGDTISFSGKREKRQAFDIPLIFKALVQITHFHTIVENAIFDEKLQDRLARSRLEFRGFEKYKAGKISTEALIKGLANEWAALPPDASNKSRYEGVLNNRALTKFEILKALLEKR